MELLSPGRKDIKRLYEGEFFYMAEEQVSLEKLEATREHLTKLVNAELTVKEKQFLLSFKNKTPDWNLLKLKDVENLPAVNWKLMNLRKMPVGRHKAAYEKLNKLLGR